MNDATATKTAQKATATAAAKGKEAPKAKPEKPEKGKVVTGDFASKGKGKDKPAAEPKADKAADTVFRVDAKKGPLRSVKIKDAVEDILTSEANEFNKETVEEMLAKGQVVFSDSFYYCTEEKGLKKWVREAPPVSDPPAAIGVGSTVYNSKANWVGTVIEREGKLLVEFFIRGEGRTQPLSNKWETATEEQIKGSNSTLALEAPKQRELAIYDVPLTVDEQNELAEREAAIVAAKTQFEGLPFVMGANLDAIREKSLFRAYRNADGTPMNFGQYAFSKFGITREYAQNLAQLSGFHRVAMEAVETSEQLQLSVKSANEMARSTNRFAKELGLERIPGFEEMRPIIKNVTRMIADIAPKNARTGLAEVTPRLVQTVSEQLSEVIKSGTIEIDGKAMKLSEAKAKGILEAGMQAQFLEATAESIHRNRDTIMRESRAAYDRATAPVVNGGGAPKAAVEYHRGVVPTLELVCTRHTSHNPNPVISIGNGTFQTKCECRWRIDAKTNSLVCFEVKGKPVRQDQ
jgi:hypothetical protein